MGQGAPDRLVGGLRCGGVVVLAVSVGLMVALALIMFRIAFLARDVGSQL